MEEQLYNSLETYFTHLENTGYFKQSEVNKLLVLVFINTVLNSDMSSMLTSEDYCLIQRALYCLYGSSCLFPYPECGNTGLCIPECEEKS